MKYVTLLRYNIVGNKLYKIYVYLTMWNEHSHSIPKGVIAVSDKQIKYALPTVDAKIRDIVEKE